MTRGAVAYWCASGVVVADLLAWARRDLELPLVDRPRAVFVHPHPHGGACVPGCRDLVAELELERPFEPPRERVRDVRPAGERL